MNADRIYIFDKAYCYFIIFCVSYDLKLKLFPAEDALFNENLSYQRSLKSSCADNLKLVHVVNHAAACAAHCICRTKNNRVFKLLGNFNSLVDRIGHLTFRHTDSKLFHSVFEFDSVLSTLDSVDLNADDLNVIFFKNSCLIKLGAKIKTGLSAQIRKQSVGTFLFDYLSKSCKVKRLYIGDISYIRICHDSSRVGVYENYFVAKLTQSLASLSSRIVEFTGLTDNNRS